MRYDTPIYFQRLQQGEYNPDTGNYAEKPPIEEMRLASVTNTGAETLKLVYGALKQDSFTVRLQTHYDKPFDFIRIGEKSFRVDRARKLRRMHTFVVSGVQ